MILRGVLLFLFIPLVLALFLAEPFGVLPSLVLGIAIMLGHRFLAMPFSERHREHRCLWCGRSVSSEAGRITVLAPQTGEREFRVCPAESRDCGRRWHGLHHVAVRGGLIIQMGIVLPLVHYLLAELVRGWRGSSWISHDGATMIFQGGIALTVVAVSFLYLWAQRDEPSPETRGRPFPFPVHNLTLLGAGWTMWIFRIVGTWWLIPLARRVLDL